jgi:hypothetical protein
MNSPAFAACRSSQYWFFSYAAQGKETQAANAGEFIVICC